MSEIYTYLAVAVTVIFTVALISLLTYTNISEHHTTIRECLKHNPNAAHVCQGVAK